MSAPPLIPPGPLRRRAGSLLLAYGIVGILLMGILLAATATAAFLARDGFTVVDDAIAEAAAVLDETDAALRSAESALAGISVGLGEAALTFEEATTVTGDLGAASSSVGDLASGFEIFGQKPLGALAGPFTSAGTSLVDLSARTSTVAGALRGTAEDVTELGGHVGAIATQLAESRLQIDEGDPRLGISGTLAVLVILGIIVWLGAPGVIAVWVGLRWRRENPKDAPPAA